MSRLSKKLRQFLGGLFSSGEVSQEMILFAVHYNGMQNTGNFQSTQAREADVRRPGFSTRPVLVLTQYCTDTLLIQYDDTIPDRCPQEPAQRS